MKIRHVFDHEDDEQRRYAYTLCDMLSALGLTKLYLVRINHGVRSPWAPIKDTLFPKHRAQPNFISRK